MCGLRYNYSAHTENNICSAFFVFICSKWINNEDDDESKYLSFIILGSFCLYTHTSLLRLRGWARIMQCFDCFEKHCWWWCSAPRIDRVSLALVPQRTVTAIYLIFFYYFAVNQIAARSLINICVYASSQIGDIPAQRYCFLYVLPIMPVN